MQDFVCVIGQFGNLGCNRNKLFAELKLLLLHTYILGLKRN